MQTYFLIICCMFSAAIVHAEQTCKPDSITASTPDSQLVDNGDSTVTDSTTGLMWKKCVEGFSGDDCATGTPDYFTRQESLQQASVVNNSGGFAGNTDWRMPNINELISIIEEQCYSPAINLNRFPNTPNSVVWSGSPYAGGSDFAWGVDFYDGCPSIYYCDFDYAVRLVRGGH